MSRTNQLFQALVPMLIGQRDSQLHPEDYILGLEDGWDTRIEHWKTYYKVTQEEWDSLQRRWESVNQSCPRS